jgi:hypothetical protein
MPPQICTVCDEPHLTSDWYIVNEFKHPLRGQVECREAHEVRVRRELADARTPTLELAGYRE